MSKRYYTEAGIRDVYSSDTRAMIDLNSQAGLIQYDLLNKTM
jgi:hypothetical protein